MMKNDNYKIYIITHNGSITPYKYFENNDHYEILDISNDPFNRILSEFIGMKHIYQSKKKKPDYIGFCHYHRFILDAVISDDVFTKDSLQGFYHYYDDFNYCVPDKFSYFKKLLSFYDALMLPESTLSDIDEYLKKQKIFDYNNIIDTLTTNKYQYIGFREMFFCSYDKFKKLYKFINGFVKFIEHKYDLHNLNDWKQHMINEVITKYYDIPYRHQLLYESQYNYNLMYRDDYGYYGFCNQWRVYAYIIELLVILFCNMDNNYCETIVNDKCDIYLNIYDDIIKYDPQSIYIDQIDKDINILKDMFINRGVKFTYATTQNIINDKYDYIIINDESKNIHKSKLFNIINHNLLDDQGHILIQKNKNINNHLTLYTEALNKLYNIEQSETSEYITIKFEKL